MDRPKLDNKSLHKPFVSFVVYFLVIGLRGVTDKNKKTRGASHNSFESNELFQEQPKTM